MRRGEIPGLVAGACMAGVLLPSGAAMGQTLQELQGLSISQLQNLDVMSVTRTDQALSDAPSAIYVITRDQILRSGLTTIPEILRLAPNLQVKRISSSRYIITARGFSGNITDQNFSNKLLVLIDGRSVYTPLYSGVYWDMQDVLASDIDRIEVISGPGATLWGANAVNGVINIITRKAGDTPGGLLEVSAGNLEQSIGLLYGGHINNQLDYRLYVRDLIGQDTETATGASAHDHWMKPQGGFRLDWTPSSTDTLSLQGDAYSGSEAQPGAPDEDIAGQDLVARWVHGWSDGSSLQVLAYFDRTSRGTTGSGAFWLNTYNLDIQHTFALNDRNTITWGGGIRISDYYIRGTASLFFAPSNRTLSLGNAFVQDSITLSPDLGAVVGLKLEGDPYSGISALPSARLSWKVNDMAMVWAAVSRAIRSPTPFDRDVQERLGTIVALNGFPQFVSEKLTAYEIGARAQVDSRFSFSVSAFYNEYTNLRTIEPTNGPAFLNLTWGNGLRGHTAGFEAWGEYQLDSWWRLSASFNELADSFNFVPTASALLGTSQLGDDPEQMASLRSSMNLGEDVNVDVDLRYVSALPSPSVPAYVELNASIGWNVSDDVRLSLSGFNLLHARHFEFPAAEANAVPRSFSVGLQWRF